MQLPQLALQHEDSDQNIFVTDNPEMNILMQFMIHLKQLYNEFVRLHTIAITARNPNPKNAFFSPVTEIQRDQDCFRFVGGFLVIASLINNVDFADPVSIVQNKRIIFGTITNCEKHFFNFNQRFQATPELLLVIKQMSEAFTHIKQELSRLKLYDLPRVDLSQQSQNLNTSAQAREREDEVTLVERSHNRKRLG